jgi:hypothetical protein
MKKALICKIEKAKYISDWEIINPLPTESIKIIKYNPIFTEIGMKIWEVSDNTFDVHPDLFWADCVDDVTAITHYYENESFVLLPTDKELPKPPTDTTVSEGLNTV